MFIDEAIITVESGGGGDGCMSFRREKYVPRGGPNGGDGGDGGDVVFRADSHLATLLDFRYCPRIAAQRGGHGKGKDMTGPRGEDALIRVPLGTLVRAEDGTLLADLVEEGQEFVLLKGGQGGRGNSRFVTSRLQAPRRADPGEPGQQAVVRLELRLMADVGLVGFPNAGKSTLLSRLSAAHPKIADYPFTTLEPQLGIVGWAEYESFALADLPGLIEGAHQGKGLGLRFLRHIERTRTLLFTLDCTSPSPARDLETLRQELGHFDPLLLEKPYAIAFTKADLLGPGEAFADPFSGLAVTRFLISGVSGQGLRELVVWLGTLVKEQRQLEGARLVEDAGGAG
ncbi:MAG: GTPase ObgE [Candidatus Latescibacteria bacterium]|nr:GTPase ObgE [Candidatus Latescibacterota bacterium]